MVFKIVGVLLSIFWLFLAFIVQMVFVAGNYAPNISSVSKIIGVFLLLSTPAIIYVSKLIYAQLLKSKISIILVFATVVLILGLMRGGYILNSNIKTGGNPIAIAFANDKTYVFDKGNQIYCGGNDPPCIKTVNPVIWVIDNRENKLLTKLKISDENYFQNFNPNDYPRIGSFQNKLYYPYGQKLLTVDTKNNSTELIDLNTVVSKPLLKSFRATLRARSFYIDPNSQLLYLLFAPSVYDPDEEPVVLEVIDLETLTEKFQADIKGKFIISDFSLPLKSVFVGGDGLIRIVTAPKRQTDDYEFALTTINPSANIVEEFNTNISAGRAPVFIDQENGRLYLPSENQYLSFDFINRVIVNFETEKAIKTHPLLNIESIYPIMAIDNDNLYFLFSLEKGTKFVVIDRDSLTQLSSFQASQEFTRFNTIIGGSDGILYIAKKNNLFVYNSQGKLINKISLK